MVELIFSDSGAASLSIAKRTGDKSRFYPMEIITDCDGNEEINCLPHEEYTGPFIDGDVSEVLPIWLMGDIGDISALPDFSSRTEILRELEALYAMEEDPGWIDAEARRAEELTARLKEAANSGEDVRIWYSATAEEYCGLHWAMSVLGDKGRVTAVKIPEMWTGCAGKIMNSTGGLWPEDFHALFAFEREVKMEERKALRSHWSRLTEENSSLRAVVNGAVCSVPESFYDFVLYKVFPKGEFRVVDAVGRALTEYPPGVRDWWYAKRILRMIDMGKLKIIKTHKKLYYTTVCRTD